MVGYDEAKIQCPKSRRPVKYSIERDLSISNSRIKDVLVYEILDKGGRRAVLAIALIDCTADIIYYVDIRNCSVGQ